MIAVSPIAPALYEDDHDGLTLLKYRGVDNAAKDDGGKKIIDVFNAQFHNGWASLKSTADYDRIVKYWDPSRISLTVMDSKAAGIGWEPLGTVTKLVGELKKKYPTFRGVTAWEYFDAGTGDNTDPKGWISKVRAALDN